MGEPGGGGVGAEGSIVFLAETNGRCQGILGQATIHQHHLRVAEKAAVTVEVFGGDVAHDAHVVKGYRKTPVCIQKRNVGTAVFTGNGLDVFDVDPRNGRLLQQLPPGSIIPYRRHQNRIRPKAS